MKRGELKLAERGENLAHKVKTTDGCRGEALGDRKKNSLAQRETRRCKV